MQLTYKHTLLAYCILFLGLFSPYLLLGDVVAPHRQYLETGGKETPGGAQYIENRKFNDFTQLYIPTIAEQLNSNQSGWLTLWTNQNELGRPVIHLAGFSAAYLPSWVIAKFTDNAWHFATALSLLTCFFAGIFVLLYCREIGLSPLAGLIAATTLAASPLLMYWLTFPMFPAVWCWAAGALWAVTWLANRPSLAGWSILAFCVYSLLMTAYPQPVIFHAYILTGYAFYLAHRKQRLGLIEAGRFLALSSSAAIAGGVLALPVYMDLAHIASESGRVAASPSFFVEVLPSIKSITDGLRFLAVSTVPELFGNPIEANYPFPYDGVSVTPLHMFFAVIGLLVARRQTWGWWLTIVILCLLAFIHPLYEFAVKYLGFNLSRSTPLGSIMLPLTVIVAYGADALVGRSTRGQHSRLIGIAIVSILAVIAVGLGFGLVQAVVIRWSMVLAMLIMVALLAAQHDNTRPIALLLSLVLMLATISHPLMLRQDMARISLTSPLIEKMRANLPEGSRFAVAAPGLSVLPPNFNAEFGLPSVHSYNSLSSRRYHVLIEALGGEMRTYGRWNSAISPDYDSPMFWMSNIGMMLSPAKLTNKNLDYLGEEAGVHLYRVISRMGDGVQFILPRGDTVADSLGMVDPRRLVSHIPSKLSDEGDLLEFAVTPAAPSVLVLSQKYHRDWQAQALGQSGWAPADAIVVNGVFQGVFLPHETKRVRLAFKPYARYAWVTHGFWLFLLVLLGCNAWRKMRRFRSEGSSIA